MKLWIQLLAINAIVIGVLGFKRSILNSCLKEKNVTELEYQVDRYYEPSNNRRVRCLYFCLIKKAGWVSEAGEAFLDKIFGLAPDTPTKIFDEMTRVVQRCMIEGDDGCEIAHALVRCVEPDRKRLSGKSFS